MLTANIKAQSMNQLDTTKASKTAGSNSKSNKTSFDDFMNSSSNDKNTSKSVEVSAKEERITSSQPKGITKGKDDVLDTKDYYHNSFVEEQKENIDTVDGDTENMSAMLENMASLIAALQETISQVLGISKETLNQAMNELGFEPADLLNNDNLKQLVLFLNNSQDVTDLLTDENLGNSLKQLLDTVNQFKMDHDLSNEKIISYQETVHQTAAIINEVVENADNPVEAEPKIILVKNEVKPVEADQDNSELAKENSSQNRRKDTSNLSPAESFIQNLAVKSTQETGFTEQIANIRQMQDITNQIVEQIKITINPSQTAMELQLNPENLGKVNLSVVYKEGVMTAHFTAQNEAVKEALESQIQVLKDNFSNQGLKVESVEVTVSNFTFKDQTSGNTGHESEQPSQRNRQFRTMDDIGQKEDQPINSLGVLDETISSVDIIA